ncbi:PAS domain-containing sensor histidine kinase [Komagataeibacter intermedius]|uniref:histidine kinase n=2 Tax=Komagataeibacter intermedius TaxID=66229 RepID=A0A0N0MFE5_9PROT|nr:PAS domain-containing sensor histidine kinase [Komagataeibacter intermedius]KPH87516.1 sensor histidine kinase [Komagataeibacter intermedius AF2]MCF3636235.1 PAS domain-containing sensor histidine kinase [Komagataeibacter intermedius]GAN87355.1 two component sensor histidine kinase NtrY [Komagataeibacter intermedius TF2]GBQ64174.1 two component sensor histidine kinase NtrY [Komagataeibacter intermedius NRIC 0521]
MTMNATQRSSVAYRLARRVLDMLVRRNVALVLVLLALVLGVATFVVLSGGKSLAHHPQLQALVFILNFLVLLLLATSLTEKIGRVLAERRSGLAGARLHVRLVTLFGIVAVAPTIVVGTFAAVFFHYGIQIWFSDRVNTALNEALETSRGYLQEHNANIRTEAFSLANYLVSAQNGLSGSGGDLLHDPDALSQVLDSQATLRGLDVAVVYDPFTNTVVASGGLMGRAANRKDLPPPAATLMARTNEIAILDSPDEKTVRAVVTLGDTPSLMLMIERPVDPDILEHMHRTEQVVADYQRLNGNRAKIQFTFVLIFALVAVLVLGAAILIGLMLANQIVRPLGLLILASERVSKGNLDSNVPEGERDDEVSSLSRAFNRMTTQLATQRAELVNATNQINERRRFTEAVLSGVSAGVIGLDSQGMIELPNRAASVLLQRDMSACVGQSLTDVVPELGTMLGRIAQEKGRELTGEVQVLAGGRACTLLVRIGAEMQSTVTGDFADGYVVTFDDITALQVAQRKAAWADVARRIAHEIKNPLTPIQLAAERLKRRFLREISSDPDTFAQCVDTIIRHVGDIGRMVDEFSAFARMPQPVMRMEDLSRIVREALILQRNAHPEIRYEVNLPDRGPLVKCDRRLVGQALTNLLQNAADAIAMRPAPDTSGGDGVIGVIRITLTRHDPDVVLSVEDDGIGLPVEDRARLTEPYVTHKPKGTGLGLAIVKKILEDHGGSIGLADRAGSRGAVSTLILPIKDDHGA